jgi:pseudouridine synthase
MADRPAGDGGRLHKLIAASGWCSRRQAEELIRAGRVTVNGRVAALGEVADIRHDTILIDGRPLGRLAGFCYLLMHKPVGVVTTMRDPGGRTVVTDLLHDVPGRVYPVGRLDLTTSGLLLLTNDGDLANRLAHPSYGVAKTYLATVAAPLARGVGRQLTTGIELEDGPVRADSFKVVQSLPGQVLVEIVLHEGRNHIVRRMFEAVGHPVISLVRTRIGPIVLGQQRPGTVRVVSGAEERALYTEVGL